MAKPRSDWPAKARCGSGCFAATLACLSVLLGPVHAQATDPMLLHDADGLSVRAHVEAGVNVVFERNMFWDLGRSTAPTSNFDPNGQWLEGYIKPGLSWSRSLADGLTAYGKLSLVASGTAGTDAFNAGNTGRVTLEEAYVGFRAGQPGGLTFDFSLGPREFRAGTGMLLANGGTSGFERGALKLGPRKAWEFAALGRVALDRFTATAFYLDPNEVPTNNSSTRIAGFDLRYDGPGDTFAGVTYGHVLHSRAPYPQAAPGGIGPPNIIPNGRDGLNFINVYARVKPLPGSLEEFFIAADYAYQWNRSADLQAWGGRLQIGYTFVGLPWSPMLMYSYQTFSGDNPATRRLERFDPLYFEGSPSAWSTGSKSSMVFINSNVNAHQITLRLSPTNRDTLTFRYAYISANELRSPIQFGQGTRLEEINGVTQQVAGVTRKHLVDDFFVEYTRKLSQHAYLTAGFSMSFPAAGIASIVPTRTPVWTGGFVNVVVVY